jgi:hypothetical protein
MDLDGVGTKHGHSTKRQTQHPKYDNIFYIWHIMLITAHCLPFLLLLIVQALARMEI